MITPKTYFDHERLIACQRGKEILHETVSLLVGLIRSIDPAVEYRISPEQRNGEKKRKKRKPSRKEQD